MTWDEIARTFDVRRCAACQSGDHQRGWARAGVVHWADRRMSKAGLRLYLMLVATQRLLGIDDMTPWQRIYVLNTWATTVALNKYHVRLPFNLTSADRARVRWFATKDPTVPEKVRRWANRRNTP